MLRKSVETRDWLNCLEPRSVRAVMKRVVEELASFEATLGELYETGHRTAASSDSSRKTHISNNLTASKQQFRSNWSNYTPTQLENSFVSNIHRLFSERVEIFGSVEFSKVSILTGIVKISLKVIRVADNHTKYFFKSIWNTRYKILLGNISNILNNLNHLYQQYRP